MTLKKIECPRCGCWRRPVILHNGDGYPVYVCPECRQPLEDAISKAYAEPPRDKMVRAAKVNKRVNDKG